MTFALLLFNCRSYIFEYLMTSSPSPVAKSSWTKFVDTVQPFWIGGLSGVLATCVIQPVDMIKVVIQLESE